MRFTQYLRGRLPSTTASRRLELLQGIYKPHFGHLDPKGEEYARLAASGKVWEDHFKPAKLEPFLKVQNRFKSQLHSIDKLKNVLKPEQVTRALLNSFSLQSSTIEGNPLLSGDSVIIESEMEHHKDNILSRLETLDANQLSHLTLPGSEELLPSSGHPDSVIELRNHILVSRYITRVALANPYSSGLPLSDLRHLSRALLVGTSSERIFSHGWGRRIELGDYRATCITVRSYPLEIFPYPAEVPTLVERLFHWRDETHESKALHPLILAVQLYSYFEHIHPFPDGNGRLGRCLMHDYLVRQGYLPIVFVDLERHNHLAMVNEAHSGDPTNLCAHLIETQMEMQFELSLRHR